MKCTNFLKKSIAFVMSGALFLAVPLSAGATAISGGDAAAEDAEGTVSEETVETEEAAQGDAAAIEEDMNAAGEIPDVVGMNYIEAETLLAGYGEVIETLTYSDAYDLDTVMEQRVEEGRIYLTISMGPQPQERLLTMAAPTQKMNATSSFGLASFSGSNGIVIDGDFSDWEGVPFIYDYDYLNIRNEVWNWGVWIQKLNRTYKVEEGVLDNNFQNEISFVVDDEYAYIRVKRATVSGPSSFYFSDYQIFASNGEYARFNIKGPNKQDIQVGQGQYTPGVHEVYVVHGYYSQAYSEVIDGAKAYIKINDDYYNTELEMRIPLSEIVAQNPNISWQDLNTMEFYNEHIMRQRITASGAGTAPYATAAVALFSVPAGVFYLRRRSAGKSRKGMRDEQNV